MSLNRFKKAQALDFVPALEELQSGCKRSHWIWYVFPQLAGLGRSPTAQFYAIENVEEAEDYLDDAELRGRLEEITRVVVEKLQAGVPLTTLMGGETDSLKLVSSLTLFRLVAERLERESADPQYRPLADLFAEALQVARRQGFVECEFTRSRLAEACPD